jgi:hypothetical protein
MVLTNKTKLEKLVYPHDQIPALKNVKEVRKIIYYA